MERAREQGAFVPAMVTTDYINSIPPSAKPWFPGNEDIERRIRGLVRWNTAPWSTGPTIAFDGLGGHSPLRVGRVVVRGRFNHFFRGKSDGGFGDQIYFQVTRAGHLRRAVPRRTPDRGSARSLPPRDVGWGSALLSAPAAGSRRSGSTPPFRWARSAQPVYQARFNRYHLQPRDPSTRRTHACGASSATVKLDEPEATAALDLAARERLDT